MEHAATMPRAASPRFGVLVTVLLACGILAAVIHIAADPVAAAMYPGYSYTAQQVSELSALGAPTRPFWVAMGRTFAVLTIAFAAGVWLSAVRRPILRATAVLLVVWAVIGVLWPPMNQRGSLGSLNDVLHVVFAGVQVLVMMTFIAFGAAALKGGFRVYSIATIVGMLVAGGVIGAVAAPAMAAGEPTPWMGLVERIAVYGPLLWLGVFASLLLRGRPHELVEKRG